LNNTISELAGLQEAIENSKRRPFVPFRPVTLELIKIPLPMLVWEEESPEESPED